MYEPLHISLLTLPSTWYFIPFAERVITMDSLVASDSDMRRWKFTGAQVQAQIRKGARDMGLEEPVLAEDDAAEMVLGVSL